MKPNAKSQFFPKYFFGLDANVVFSKKNGEVSL